MELSNRLTTVDEAIKTLKEEEEDTQLYELKLQNLMLVRKLLSPGYHENVEKKNNTTDSGTTGRKFVKND